MQLKPSHLHRFHAALAKWYGAHGRNHLPWRQTRDPYAIWVSEIMLQQTQVETVRTRFYAPFLAQFPTVEALARAPRDAVMKAWEGLGYYRRAGHLHKAAKQLVLSSRPSTASVGIHSRKIRPRRFSESRCDTFSVPDTLEHLLALPGIGRNTAHAMLAFGFHQPYAVMEANVKRVISRVFALATPSDAELWHHAEALLNRNEPFNYNQAMMDLGAMICTVKTPNCAACPAAFFCKGKASPEQYPAKKLAKKISTRRVVIVVQRDGKGRYLLEQRDNALLGGLYGFAQHDAAPKGAKKIGDITHVYSHFRLQGEVVLLRAPAKQSNQWYSLQDIEKLPLSKLDHKVLALLATTAA